MAQTTTKKFYTWLATSLKYTNIHVVVTPYLSNYIHLPVIQTQVHTIPQPPVDQSTQAGVSTPLQVLPPNSSSSKTASQVDIRADQGIVEPQSPTQVIEPNTESYIPQQSTSRPELPVRRKMSDKVGTVSEPTTLPPLKKRKTFREASVSPSVSSQYDMDFEMANEQYLGSFYQ